MFPAKLAIGAVVSPAMAAPHNLAGVQTAFKHTGTTAATSSDTADLKPLGYHTALIAEASDARSSTSLLVDGASGDTDFPHGNLKAICTVGEYDKTSGYMPVGVPDGMGAMLADADTVRVIWQAESYGYIAQYPSYPMKVNNDATAFTGSHIAYVDYDRDTMRTFMENTDSAESMVTGAGELIEKAYNLKGNLVGARQAIDTTRNDVHFGDTNKDGKYVSADIATNPVANNLWTYHSFCSAHLEEKEQWGSGIGLKDDIFLTVEEWTSLDATRVEALGFVGLSAHAVDVATKTAYAVGAFGMGGFEKIVEVNCGNTNYVCFSLSGYNGNFGSKDEQLTRKKAQTANNKRDDGTDFVYPQNIVPSRLYVGVKGYAADCTTADTTGFLARNGLACGRVYGFAVPEATTDRDAWHKGNFRNGHGDDVTGYFAQTQWQWDGTVTNFDDDQAWDFQNPPKNEAASGASTTHKFWTGAGINEEASKTEHNSPDPRGGNRFIQGSTAGYMGIYDFTGVKDVLDALTVPNLPAKIDATYTIVEGESKVSDRIDLGGKGKRADGNDQTMMRDSSADKHTFEDIDGLEWIAAADNKDYLIIQEDGGNMYGERMLIAELPAAGVMPEYKFIAQAGGSYNTRTKAGVSVPAGTATNETARASEFSGVADLSGILKSGTALGGYARRQADATVAIEDKYIAVGLQHHSATTGVISDFNLDRGGQVYIYKPDNMLRPHELAGVQTAFKHTGTTAATSSDTADLKPLGYHTALIAEASDARSSTSLLVDGASGDTDFPHGNLKAICTVGEYDKTSGYMPVGVPDGMGAMLADADTVRVIWQAESYGYIAQYPSYPMKVNNDATAFTGSHIAYVDYDRDTMRTFMENTDSAESMVTGAGELIEKAYNLKGNLVGARQAIDTTRNDVHFGDTNKDGKYVSADIATNPVANNLWTYHSFCSAHLEEKEQWGSGIGLKDDIFLTVEEWTSLDATRVEALGFVGLSAHAVDVATKTAYAVGAFGMGGFEKIVEVNCGNTNYVCFSLSGYNGNFGSKDEQLTRKKAQTANNKRDDGTDFVYPQNIVPSRLYVGVKGYAADCTTADTTGFLARNGLACGRVYGFAVPEATTDRDAWHKGNFRNGHGDDVTGYFAQTQWQWDGTVTNFDDDQAWDFQNPPKNEAASGASTTHKFWTGAGINEEASKTEHNSPDPRGGNRFIQGSTAGYMGIYDFTGVKDVLDALTVPNLPAKIDATYTIVEGESKVSDRIDLGGKGKRADGNDQTMMRDSSADKHTFEDIDGLEWIAAADNKDYLIIQEDGGNMYGERMLIAELPAAGVMPEYKFIAQAGGSYNTRTKAGVSVPAGTATNETARASEFSGVADLSGILKSGTALGGYARRQADATVAIEDKYIAVGLQHHSATTGVISDFNLDRGGQVYIYKPNDLEWTPAAPTPAPTPAEETELTAEEAVSPAVKVKAVSVLVAGAVLAVLA